jgi:dTDP-4-amino-4,6-dideoxygalactose transaminase
MKNFLPQQYKKDKKLKINHNYLSKQFVNYKSILKKISKVVLNNDFTLGSKVDEFELKIKKLLRSKYVVAVGSGTDAIMLSLKAIGVKEGDEVITTPYTFYATIGAIVTAGAKPVFVDVQEDYNMDPNNIIKKITKKTKAIVVVHWSGRICDMKSINKISKKFKIPIVEDACHAILAKQGGVYAGNFGEFGCFSMHPLKNLNIWGDGGFILTNNKNSYEKMMLLRNHGLVGRNINKIFGYNSRLDTIQAVVAIELLKKIKFITKKRIQNSLYLDNKLRNIIFIQIKNRQKNNIEVFHLYEIRTKSKYRDDLVNYLRKKSIDAKIHYPVPMHLQPAAKYLKYKKGDFPISENIANTTISLPVHEFISRKDLDYISNSITEFFK